jgi:hypothetical protein
MSIHLDGQHRKNRLCKKHVPVKKKLDPKETFFPAERPGRYLQPNITPAPQEETDNNVSSGGTAPELQEQKAMIGEFWPAADRLYFDGVHSKAISSKGLSP